MKNWLQLLWLFSYVVDVYFNEYRIVLGRPSTIAKMHEFVELKKMKVAMVFYMGKLKVDLFEGNRKPIEDKVK